MKKNVIKSILGFSAVLLFAGTVLSGCGKKDSKELSKKEITVGVTAGPHQQIMEEVAKQAKKDGLKIKIKSFTDYNTPNSALSSGDLDANSYQTIPFLKDQIKNKGYKFDQAFKTVAYPMGVYSKKIKSLKDLKDGDSAGIIKLKKGVGQTATKKDVVSNPKHLKIIELEASQLPKQLGEVTAAAINTNFAMGAGLSINENAIFHEPLKNNPYPNVFVVQSGHKNDAVIKKIDKYYHSKQTAAFIKKEFKGSVVLSSSK